MYFIETTRNDEFHKYVASMTASAVRGVELDEGVYMFDDEKSCDRAVGIVNKMYGSGIFTVVTRSSTGLLRPVLDKPMVSEKEKKPTEIKVINTKPQSASSLAMRIIRGMGNEQEAIPNEREISSTVVQPQAETNEHMQITDIRQAISKTMSTVKKKAPTTSTSTSKTVGSEIDLDQVVTIGMDQYELSEDIGDFDVAPARPPVERRE